MLDALFLAESVSWVVGDDETVPSLGDAESVGPIVADTVGDATAEPTADTVSVEAGSGDVEPVATPLNDGDGDGLSEGETEMAAEGVTLVERLDATVGSAEGELVDVGGRVTVAKDDVVVDTVAFTVSLARIVAVGVERGDVVVLMVALSVTLSEPLLVGVIEPLIDVLGVRAEISVALEHVDCDGLTVADAAGDCVELKLNEASVVTVFEAAVETVNAVDVDAIGDTVIESLGVVLPLWVGETELVKFKDADESDVIELADVSVVIVEGLPEGMVEMDVVVEAEFVALALGTDVKLIEEEEVCVVDSVCNADGVSDAVVQLDELADPWSEELPDVVEEASVEALTDSDVVIEAVTESEPDVVAVAGGLDEIKLVVLTVPVTDATLGDAECVTELIPLAVRLKFGVSDACDEHEGEDDDAKLPEAHPDGDTVGTIVVDEVKLIETDTVALAEVVTHAVDATDTDGVDVMRGDADTVNEAELQADTVVELLGESVVPNDALVVTVTILDADAYSEGVTVVDPEEEVIEDAEKNDDCVGEVDALTENEAVFVAAVEIVRPDDTVVNGLTEMLLHVLGDGDAV